VHLFSRSYWCTIAIVHFGCWRLCCWECISVAYVYYIYFFFFAKDFFLFLKTIIDEEVVSGSRICFRLLQNLLCYRRKHYQRRHHHTSKEHQLIRTFRNYYLKDHHFTLKSIFKFTSQHPIWKISPGVHSVYPRLVFVKYLIRIFPFSFCPHIRYTAYIQIHLKPRHLQHCLDIAFPFL